MSVANAFERRAQVLFADIARLTSELLGDPPELGSDRMAGIVRKVDALGDRFGKLSADVRREKVQVDARLAGLSRYIRGDIAFRERQRHTSRQEQFHAVQLLVREVGAALKGLTDILLSPPLSVTAKGVHDLIEEFSKTVANFTQKTQTMTSKEATISAATRKGMNAEMIQTAADGLLMFSIFFAALARRLSSRKRRTAGT